MAQFLQARGDIRHKASDLEQLFRRVAFNVAIANRDDHLRNHGFILGDAGWRLAPAFDMNPSVDRSGHVLHIDDADNRPDLGTVVSTAAFYGLSNERALSIIESVVAVVAEWESVARRAGIPAAEISPMRGAFITVWCPKR